MAMAEEWDSGADTAGAVATASGRPTAEFLIRRPMVTGYPVSKTDEMEMLRADADAMRQSLESVQHRIAELEKEGSE